MLFAESVLNLSIRVTKKATARAWISSQLHEGTVFQDIVWSFDVRSSLFCLDNHHDASVSSCTELM